MEKREIQLYVVCDGKSRISEKIINKISSFYLVKFYFITYAEYLEISDQKVHLIIFDNIDMDTLSYAQMATIQERNKSVHSSAILKSVSEEQVIKVYDNHIDYLFNHDFSDKYFIAKIKSILKRKSDKYQIENSITKNRLTIDLLMNEAYFDDVLVDTTKLEIKLLKTLVKTDDFITKGDLYQKIWKYGNDNKDSTRVLDQLIHRVGIKFPELKLIKDRKLGIKIPD